MAFQEIPGTLWSVFLISKGKPVQRLLLTAPTAEVAREQARIVATPMGLADDVSEAEAVLLAMCKPRNKFVNFTYIPTGTTPNAIEIVKRAATAYKLKAKARGPKVYSF
jgi:hypothetical protein